MRITKPMFRVLMKMQAGTALYCHQGRRWLDCAFEAGVKTNTFFALLRRGLIQPSRRISLFPVKSQRRWMLTEKGKRV